MIDDEFYEEYEKEDTNSTYIPSKKPSMRIILLDNTIEELKYNATPFITSQKGIKPLKTIDSFSFIECYCTLFKGKKIFNRLELFLNSIGLSIHNTIYGIMSIMIGNTPLTEDLIGVFRVGEAEMAKSSMTSLVFTDKEKRLVRGGIPTEPWLRGRDLPSYSYDKRVGEAEMAKSSMTSLVFTDKEKRLVRGGIPTEPWLRGRDLPSYSYDKLKADKVPLEYSNLVYEEIRGISDIENSLQYHKQVTESGSFMRHNLIPAKTKSSITFIANDYTKGHDLSSFTLDKIFSRLPKIFREDEAIFDRYPFVIPHYKKTMGKIKYIEKDTKGIAVEDLEEVIKELREKRCLINLDKYKLKGRERRIFYKGISSFMKIIYPECVMSAKKVPEYILDGVFEFVKHFNSFTVNKKIYNPFNRNSAKFILEILGFSIKKVEYVIFHEERILIKNLAEDVFYKIGLTGYGCEQNIKEWKFFKENSNKISEIFSCEENGISLIQKAHELSSEDIIWISEKKNILDEEINRQILAQIENEDFDNLPTHFVGTPNFFIKIAESEAKRIFQINNPDVTKNNFVLVDGEIKFVNFSEFIRENNEE